MKINILLISLILLSPSIQALNDCHKKLAYEYQIPENVIENAINACINNDLNTLKNEVKKFPQLASIAKQLYTDSGFRLLEIATQKNNLAMVKYLIESCNADIYGIKYNSPTLLYYAVCNKNLDMVKYLVKDRYFEIENVGFCNFRDTPLQASKDRGLKEIESFLTKELMLQKKIEAIIVKDDVAAFGQELKQQRVSVNALIGRTTLLGFAVEAGSINIIKYLLNNGVKVNATNDRAQKYTALHYAFSQLNYALVKQQDSTNEVNIVNLLLDNGAQVDIADAWYKQSVKDMLNVYINEPDKVFPNPYKNNQLNKDVQQIIKRILASGNQ